MLCNSFPLVNKDHCLCKHVKIKVGGEEKKNNNNKNLAFVKFTSNLLTGACTKPRAEMVKSPRHAPQLLFHAQAKRKFTYISDHMKNPSRKLQPLRHTQTTPVSVPASE